MFRQSVLKFPSKNALQEDLQGSAKILASDFETIFRYTRLGPMIVIDGVISYNAFLMALYINR